MGSPKKEKQKNSKFNPNYMDDNILLSLITCKNMREGVFVSPRE